MIAGDAKIDERMGPIFSMGIELETSWSGEGEFRQKLQLGMKATAEVKTGDARWLNVRMMRYVSGRNISRELCHA